MSRNDSDQGFFTLRSVRSFSPDAEPVDENIYVVVDNSGATFTIDEEDTHLSTPPFSKSKYSPPSDSSPWLPLRLLVWNWVFGGTLAVTFLFLPITVISLAIPIASFFAVPALLLQAVVLFYAIPICAYLLLAQSAPPPHAGLPFRPPFRNLRLLLKINLAVLQWTQRALHLVWTVFPELVRTKILYTAARGWHDRIKTNILYGSTYSRNTLDIYLPKPAASGSLGKDPSGPPVPNSTVLTSMLSTIDTATERPRYPGAPILIFIQAPHYGPFRSKKWMMASLGRNLARMGYCVIIPDIIAFEDDVIDLRRITRHPPKSSSTKVQKIHSPSRIRETMEDLRRVMRWAADHASKFGGDPQQIYLGGHGLGAHTVLLHCIQKAVVASRDALFKSVPASQADDATDKPPHISISNGMRRVQEYAREIWTPKVQGLILLSPVCDVEMQVLMESEQGVSHLSTVRRSLGPGQLPCIMHSPAHILHASRNAIDIAELPRRILFLHGGFDRVVNWSQSESMKELFRGVGVENVRSRVYTTGHTGILTALMSHTRGSVVSAHVLRELRQIMPLPEPL